jgi:hypothetical protein
MGALERHYRAKELAALWGMSHDTISRLFAREPGVLRVNRVGKGKKQKYAMISIPESVALRVHERHAQAAAPGAGDLYTLKPQGPRQILRLYPQKTKRSGPVCPRDKSRTWLDRRIPAVGSFHQLPDALPAWDDEI